MDLIVILLWFLAFTVIVLFLGALHYFIGRPSPTVSISDKSQSDTMNQDQSLRSTNNRRKHARNANKKHRQQAAAAVIPTNDDSNSNDNDDKQEEILIIPEIKVKDEEEEESIIESSRQQSDEEKNEEIQDIIKSEEVSVPSPPPAPIREEQEPSLPVKQRNKNKNTNNRSPVPSMTTNSSRTTSISSKDEIILPSKPQACVAPVKQSFLPVGKENSMINIESAQAPQDNNSKSNGNLSSLYNIYSHSGYKSLPPRFQRQQKQEAYSAPQKFRKRKPAHQPKNLTIPPGSAARQNDFIPSTPPQQTNNQLESPVQQESPAHNGYSSELDLLSESVSTACTNNNHSSESPVSLKELDLMRSLSSPHVLLNELISVFESTSFSSDELELILSKIATKHLSNKQDWQRLLSTTTKNDKTIERILDEAYLSQVKILAIELQTEKNRVLELTKTNTDMDNIIRQLQQQPPQNNMAQYQQTIYSYQMQLRRLTDENARLVHQLHACAMMPSTINDLKQQQHILNEQLRQMNIKNSALEKEISDGERGGKHAAEIYKKADSQKQERIEQMIGDINKYKKLDKESTSLRQKQHELEKSLNSKLNDVTRQRDELKAYCDQSKEKVQQYEQLKIQYDQLIQNQKHEQTRTPDEVQEELIEVKAKNDLLRQRNWKVMEQLNKLLDQQKANEKIQES